MLRTVKQRIWCCHDSVFKWEHEGKRYSLHIQADDNPDSPREWDNLAVMACWHRHYRLGDKLPDGVKEPEDFWRRLVCQNVCNDKLVAAMEAGELGGFRLARNEENPELVDIYETYYIRTVIGRSEASECLEYEGVPRDSVFDYVIDDLTIGNCQTLLEPYLEWLPLWLYDHSGITMSCGARTGQYADRWDSGQVGWIIAMRDKIMEETRGYVLDENGERIKEEHHHPNGQVTWSYKTERLTEETWRARAVEIMEGEVEDYDIYLRGEVYGYTLYEADPADLEDPDDDEDLDWEEIDSCWGFYGTDLLENGIPDQCGCGLYEALRSGAYEEGQATRHTRTWYTF